MSTPMSPTPPDVPSAFERIRGEAKDWIVIEAYNGRRNTYDDHFAHHETYVMAPRREDVEALTPLTLSSLVPTLSETAVVEPAARPRWLRPTCAVLAAASFSAVLGLDNGLYEAFFAAFTVGMSACAVGPQPRHGSNAGGAHDGRLDGRGPAADLKAMRTVSHEVVPEIAYVYRLTMAAPERLLTLHADTEAVIAVERAWETILREIPRLPEEAWDWKGGKRLRYTNMQKGTTAYTRIMDAGAEVLIMLRAAEEKEYALSPHTTRTGPWSQLSAEPIVVDMLEAARLAQRLSPRLPLVDGSPGLST